MKENCTKAMLAALKWLVNRSGDGVFDKTGVLVAGGERAPVMRMTWNKLDGLGLVEFHCSRKRLRVTDKGMTLDLTNVQESQRSDYQE